MAKRSKKIYRKIVLFLGYRFGWSLIWIVGKMCRIETRNEHYRLEFIEKNAGYLVAVWHGRLLLPAFYHRGQGIVAMVSQHGDGEIIARAIQQGGYKTVRGSSTRGGRQALLSMVRALKKNNAGTIMPDGPKGPRHILKAGTLTIAQLTGVPILPLSFSADRAFVFRSWDGFMLPKPGARVLINYGAPITIPRRTTPEEFEEIRLDVETRLNQLEQNADDYFRK
ncbi:lysophospholipid acyltransferase family protein [bacterium]|nr:lysophospholipid acyltransferase family protein [bacterium]